jgi:hypothetical protein
MMLYMTPWSYNELLNCKIILFLNLPKTLMDELFDWYGGVPRYVLHIASDQLAHGEKAEDVVQYLEIQMIGAIHKDTISVLIKAHRDRLADGQFSHRVLHLCRHPNNNLANFQSDWASSKVENTVLNAFAQQLYDGVEGFLQRGNDYECGNLSGLIFEARAHTILSGGGNFRARRLIEGGQNVMLMFPPTTRQNFQKLADVDLGTQVFWRPDKKNLPAIDALCGPANLFQMTVSHSHPIKHQGLCDALEVVPKSESPPQALLSGPTRCLSDPQSSAVS